MAVRSCRKNLNLCRILATKETKSKFISPSTTCTTREQHNQATTSGPQASFGLLFDIDGVLSRGKKVLPFATQAFKKLVDADGQFRVPAVFVTNAGNMMRQQKAAQLSSWLGVEITEEQVVMSHSPLRMFKQFHDKHVVVSGQGPSLEIAKGLGFTKVTTMDELRAAFPTLDAVDHMRRISVPCTFERYFPRIEAVVLFGEPVRWETHLQLLIDVLMTNGLPVEAPLTIPYPHIPILACNMDLQWMAEACMPRFGHGAFLVCLENLYKKITGKELIYKALVGKPSEITYHYAQQNVMSIAKRLGIARPIKRLYAIGDNINTDIYGANLYNRFLVRRLEIQKKAKLKNVAAAAVSQQGGGGGGGHTSGGGGGTSKIDHHHHVTAACTSSGMIESFVGRAVGNEDDMLAESCESILVQTGVYNKEFKELTEHSPRDFLPVEEKLKEPSYVTENVYNAIKLIFDREGFA